MSDNQTDMW